MVQLLKTVANPRRLKRAMRFTWRRISGSYRLKQALNEQRPVRIVVGSSGIFEPGWIPTDVEFLNLLRERDWRRHFQPASIDAILAEHVWEHLSEDDGIDAFRRCYRYLKPSAYLRVAVPDGFHPDPNYIEWVKVKGKGWGSETHQVLYTYKTLKENLESAGFEVKLLEFWDEAGHFHFTEWNPADGMIYRSKRFDQVKEERGNFEYTSLIVDAIKH